ncbi:MAG TPA: hypothetical protein VHM90_17080 [Phycisphaerae bacterium]|nr:hypothetical protein [Phycisphaerae bacterium]
MKLTLLAAAAIAAVSMFTAAPASAIVPIGGRGPLPVAPPGWVYRYVGPVYRTVADQVWIAETRRLVPVWVETSPGRMEQVYREVITPGHWETRTRQELVSAGHYELVQISPPIYIPPRVVVVNPGTAGVEGYASGQGEDMSKFSGLSEWPK